MKMQIKRSKLRFTFSVLVIEEVSLEKPSKVSRVKSYLCEALLGLNFSMKLQCFYV